MNNWHRWGRDCAILNVAREHSPAVAATRFGMEVEEVEDLVADYEEAGEELIAEYERARRQFDPDAWCHHCGLAIVPGTTVMDNGVHRFHKQCAIKRQQLGLPI